MYNLFWKINWAVKNNYNNIHVYNNECLSVCIPYAFLNSWTDFYEIFCMCLSGSLDDLDSQLDPVGTTWEGSQTGILRLMTMSIVYKWLLLVIEEMIISRN